MAYEKKNTQTLKPMIKNKIARLEKDRQRNTLLMAQCCGYRWTNEGPPKFTGKPYVKDKPKPDTDSIGSGLLGQEADERRHPSGGKY